MATAKKQRKVDTENRQFNKEWELQFFFVEGTNPQAKPVCVICGKTVAVAKKDNMKRHHTSVHTGWEGNYPVESETRKEKFNSLAHTLSTRSIVNDNINESSGKGCRSFTSYCVDSK